MAQCRRALRPDGLFLGVMWGGDTLHELRVSLSLAEQEVAGGLSQRVSPLAQVSRGSSWGHIVAPKQGGEPQKKKGEQG